MVRALPKQSLVAAAFALLAAGRIAAYPKRAGTCGEGPAIGTDGASQHRSQGSGGLSDGDLAVTIAELPAGDSKTLDANTTLTLVQGVQYRVTLESDPQSSAGFKGFLFRLSDRTGNGQDVTGSFDTQPDEADIQKLPSTGEATGPTDSACAATVEGMCHTGNALKQSVTPILTPTQPGEWKLEMTVVVNKNPNQWHYSKYDLDVIGPPSESPSALPSAGPTKSFAPSGPPSGVPSSAPSGAPTSDPTPAPVPGPTSGAGPRRARSEIWASFLVFAVASGLFLSVSL